MSRGEIPSWTELGFSTPNVERRQPPDNGRAEVGKSAARFGEALQGLGSLIQRKQDQDDLLAADDHFLKRSMEIRRSFDNDPDYHTYGPRSLAAYDQAQNEALGMIRNPAMRERWQHRSNAQKYSGVNQVLRLGDGLERQQAQSTLKSSLDNLYSDYLNPSHTDQERGDILREMDRRIQNTQDMGLLRPGVVDQVRKKYINGAVHDETLQRLQSDDPNVRHKALQDLQSLQQSQQVGPQSSADDGSAPPAQQPSTDFDPSTIKQASGGPQGAGQRKSDIEGVVIHHTSGSSLQGALATHRSGGAIGATYYIDRDGSVVQNVPESVHMDHILPPGNKYRNGAHDNLTSDNTIGIEVVAQDDKDVTPEQRATLKSFVPWLAKQHPNIKPENIVGHGEIQGGNKNPLTGKYVGGNKEPDEGTASATEIRSAMSGEKPEDVADSVDSADKGEQKASINPKVTAYSPKKGGDAMEGGYSAASAGPGQDPKDSTTWKVNTLRDYAEGRSPYVTVAGDPALNGKRYTIPSITFKDATGKTRTLTNVPAVVHDTGGAFKDKGEGRFDIPADKDLPDGGSSQPYSDQNLAFIPAGDGKMALGGPKPSDDTGAGSYLKGKFGNQVADASGQIVPSGARGPRQSLSNVNLDDPRDRLRLLDPQNTIHLYNKGSTSLRLAAQKDINADIARAHQGLEPFKDDEGRTALEIWKGILPPNEYDKLKWQYNSEKMKADATLPLTLMSDRPNQRGIGNTEGPSDFNNHYDQFVPSEEMSPEDYLMHSNARDHLDAAWKVIQDKRADDPVAAVSGFQHNFNGHVTHFPAHSLIQDANDYVSASSPDVWLGGNGSGGTQANNDPQAALRAKEFLIDQRLAAQDDVGIEPEQQKTISLDEANKLLRLPDGWKHMSTDDLTAALTRAAQRANELYGPRYGEKVFDDAIKLTSKSRGDIDNALAIGASIFQHQTSLEDLKRALWQTGRDQEDDGWFGSKAPPQSGVSPDDADFRNSLRANNDWSHLAFHDRHDPSFEPWLQPGERYSGEPAIASQASGPKEAPTPDQVELLQKRPGDWQIFDNHFNQPGLAAQILSQTSPTAQTPGITVAPMSKADQARTAPANLPDLFKTPTDEDDNGGQ